MTEKLESFARLCAAIPFYILFSPVFLIIGIWLVYEARMEKKRGYSIFTDD